MAYSSLYYNLTNNKNYNKKGGATRNFKDLIKLLNQKKEFMAKVFLNLILQLTIIGVVCSKAENYDIIKSGFQYFGLFIVMLILLFIMATIQNPFIKFILFTIFSVLMGIILSRRTKYSSSEVIKTAIFGTLGIFVGMFIFTLMLLMMGIDVGEKFGIFLLFALIILIIVTIISIFMKASPMTFKVLAGISLFIFSLFIVYDTTNILIRDYYGNDFITASLDYLLDIVNIFIDLLNLSSD